MIDTFVLVYKPFNFGIDLIHYMLPSGNLSEILVLALRGVKEHYIYIYIGLFAYGLIRGRVLKNIIYI